MTTNANACKGKIFFQRAECVWLKNETHLKQRHHEHQENPRASPSALPGPKGKKVLSTRGKRPLMTLGEAYGNHGILLVILGNAGFRSPTIP